MDTGIGATLREARGRRKADLAEVEAAIKIRIRYLQAMENEEWDALPGGAYTRGFIRTYAAYLGLDGDRLADEYRRSIEPLVIERMPKRVEPVPSGGASGRSGISGRALAIAVAVALAGLLVAIGLAGGDDEPSVPEQAGTIEQAGGRSERPASEPVVKPSVEVELAATAEVWVCLLNAGSEPLIDGVILEEGAEAGPYRSAGFEVALGNGSVDMTIDGRQAEVPASPSPVGYAIDSTGQLNALEEGERPDCE